MTLKPISINCPISSTRTGQITGINITNATFTETISTLSVSIKKNGSNFTGATLTNSKSLPNSLTTTVNKTTTSAKATL